MGFSIGCETTNLVVAAFNSTSATSDAPNSSVPTKTESFKRKKALLRLLFKQVGGLQV
jgi:hypothetical protein